MPPVMTVTLSCGLWNEGRPIQSFLFSDSISIGAAKGLCPKGSAPFFVVRNSRTKMLRDAGDSMMRIPFTYLLTEPYLH